VSDSDRNSQRQEHNPDPPPHAPPREHVREMQTHLQEMEAYLRRMGERLRRLDEQLSHLEAEDDSAVDREGGGPREGSPSLVVGRGYCRQHGFGPQPLTSENTPSTTFDE
jgi:hypothetical protein